MDHTHEFLIGLDEHTQEIYSDLDALRDAGPDGPLSRALVDRLFRRVHSIKGSASTFGLNALSQIAHEFESLLHAARTGRVVIAGSVLATCESAADALAESVNLAASGVVEPSRTHLFEQLQSITRSIGSEADSREVLASVPVELTTPLTDPEKQQLASALNEGVQLFNVSAIFDLANFDEEFFRLKENLAEWGEVISTSPSLIDSQPDRIEFRVLYAGRIDVERLAAHLNAFAVQIEPVEIPNADRPTQPRRQNLPSVSALANFVRTDLDTLDRLISSTHQLFRQTTSALELASSGNSSTDVELAARNADIKAAFLNVEDELINLRMVSLTTTLQRAARAGRTAARLAGKEIDFEVAGGDVRLDKFLADAIADPLDHLIRNAVDHGIESTDERSAAGKRWRGTITIEATSEGGRTLLRVTDDGRGIDTGLITATAQKLGIVDPGTELDLDVSLRLIFRPGFTTTESVSEVSGRGVGLDVVETSVEQVGGELRISSQPGHGTTFEIRLPVTFGIMEAQVVLSDGHPYCIPLDQTIRAEQSPNPAANSNDQNSTPASPQDLDSSISVNNSTNASDSQEGWLAPAASTSFSSTQEPTSASTSSSDSQEGRLAPASSTSFSSPQKPTSASTNTSDSQEGWLAPAPSTSSSTQEPTSASTSSSDSQEGRLAPASAQSICLRDLLGQPPSIQPSQQLLCSLTNDPNVSSQVQLNVDQILSTEKVLVRSLGRHAGRWYGVAGATELNDGSIALVLDLPRLLSTS